jgi:hypothetical protein
MSLLAFTTELHRSVMASAVQVVHSVPISAVSLPIVSLDFVVGWGRNGIKLTDMFFVPGGAGKSSVQYMDKTADVDNLGL